MDDALARRARILTLLHTRGMDLHELADELGLITSDKPATEARIDALDKDITALVDAGLLSRDVEIYLLRDIALDALDRAAEEAAQKLLEGA